MKKKLMFSALIAVLMTTTSAVPAYAVDDATVAKLVARIDALEKEVADLKAEKKEATAGQKADARQAAQVYNRKPVSTDTTAEAKSASWAAVMAPAAGDSAKNSSDGISVKLDKT